MDNPWKTLSSKKIYENGWISLREDSVIQPNGEKSVFSVVESKKYVMMIPIIDSEFYLIEQYRYPIQQMSLEFPAGGIKSGETIETTINRELVEEAGLQPNKITKIGELYVANSFSNITYSVYIVEDFTTHSISPEASEGKIKLIKVTETRIKEFIKLGKISDSQTLAAFQLYQQRRLR